MPAGQILVGGNGVGLPLSLSASGGGTLPVGTPYTYATLPSATSAPYGSLEYTSDQGMVYSNQVTWIVLASSGGGSAPPIFKNSVTDLAPGSTVNNYAPTGYAGGTTNRILSTAAAGGTTCTGLSAVGVPDGWTIFFSNESLTDSFTFPNLSGSSTTPFSTSSSVSSVLAPNTAAFMVLRVNVWKFA